MKTRGLTFDPDKLITNKDGSFGFYQKNNSFGISDNAYQAGVLGIGGINTALNIGNYIQNRATAKAQRAVLREQLKESKEEYNRLKRTRKKLNASF
jgi:hypothetical protein